MLRKLARQYEPPYIAAVFEKRRADAPRAGVSPSPIFYKANRKETAAHRTCWSRFPTSGVCLAAMKIPVLEYPGFEADDGDRPRWLRRAEEAGFEVVIVSSDKDICSS